MSNKRTDVTPNHADILDEVSHHAAQAAVARRKSSGQDREWSRSLGVKLEARVAELRRNLTPADPAPEEAKPIRTSTLAMTRDAVLDAIARLTSAMGGEVEFAHRNHKRLSDDDLRRLLDLLDTSARD